MVPTWDRDIYGTGSRWGIEYCGGNDDDGVGAWERLALGTFVW